MAMPFERERDERDLTCREAADGLIVRHGWKLLDPEDLAARSLGLLAANLASTPARAVLHAYTLALYTACAGGEGVSRREQAYVELHRYLYEIARWRYAADADELAQVALEMTFVGFVRCREPGAFLRYAIYQLQDAARALHRERGRPVDSLDRTLGSERGTFGAMLIDASQPDPCETVVRDDLRARFVACAAACERRHPRAGLQLRAVWLKYLGNLDDRSISTQIDKPVNLVHVLRSRGMRLLREQPEFRALAAELGIATDSEL